MKEYTCWQIVDSKDIQLGIGFTKSQAKMSARDYFVKSSSVERTKNQAMKTVKDNLYLRNYFFRKYKLIQIPNNASE